MEEKSIKVEEIRPEEYVITIEFKPTVPHCSLATLIGKQLLLFGTKISILAMKGH